MGWGFLREVVASKGMGEREMGGSSGSLMGVTEFFRVTEGDLGHLRLLL